MGPASHDCPAEAIGITLFQAQKFCRQSAAVFIPLPFTAAPFVSWQGMYTPVAGMLRTQDGVLL